MKKLFSLLMILCLTVCMLPTAALADEDGNTNEAEKPFGIGMGCAPIQDYIGNGSVEITDADTLASAYDVVCLANKAFYVLSKNGSSDSYYYDQEGDYATKTLMSTTLEADDTHQTPVKLTATYQDDNGNEVDASKVMFLLTKKSNSTYNQSVNANSLSEHYWLNHTNTIYDFLNTKTRKESFAYSFTNEIEYAAVLNTWKDDMALKPGIYTTTNYNALSTTEGLTDKYSSTLLGDKFFPFSATEVMDPAYGLNTVAARYAFHEAGSYKSSSSRAAWWLRSSPGKSQCGAIDKEGTFTATNSISETYPAFNFNMDSVLFVSDFTDKTSGKAQSSSGSFVPLADKTTSTWKLTMKDNSQTLEIKSLTDNGDGTYTLSFKGPYKDGEFQKSSSVSALITDDSGETIYYYSQLGKSTNYDVETSVTFSLPEGITLGDGYRLFVFPESISNKERGTDYAGALIDVTPEKTPVSIAITTVPDKTEYTAGESFDSTGMAVTATYEDGSTAELSADKYTVSYPTDSYGDGQNDSKFHITKTVAENGTLTNKGEPQVVTISCGGQDARLMVKVYGIAQEAPTDLTVEALETGDGWKIGYIGDKTLEYTMTDPTGDGVVWHIYDENTEIKNTSDDSVNVYFRYPAKGDYAPGAVATAVLPGADKQPAEVIPTAEAPTTAEGVDADDDLVKEVVKALDPTDVEIQEDQTAGITVTDSNAQNALVTAANTVLADNTVSAADGKEALESGNITVNEGDKVTIVIQPYLDVQILEVSKTEEEGSATSTLKLEITPMYRKVATTNTEEIVLEDEMDENGSITKGKNAVELQDESGLLTVSGTNTVSISLPSGFMSGTVYIEHTKDGHTYIYTGTIDGSNVLTFKNPHGFSTFTITTTNHAVASITKDSTTDYYATFQDAVDAALDDAKTEDGATITILNTEESLTAAVTDYGSFKFTLNIKEGSDVDISKVSINGYKPDDNNVISFTQSSGTITHSITISAASNGSVTSNRTRAGRGATVTLTVTPDEGYELDGLTVTDAGGNTLALTDKGDGKYTFTMPASRVTVTATFKVAEHDCPSKIFTDVDLTQYYHWALDWAVVNGVTNGTSATTFSPDASCTRAQMVTFLWRAAGSPAPVGAATPFTDLDSGAYYYDAVLWATEKGITNGTSATTFSPDATVIRGQAVTFLYRYAGSPAVSGSNNFTDVPVNAYYADAVQWAAANKITNGTSTTTFSPKSDCTRAQIVTMLYRYIAE